MSDDEFLGLIAERAHEVNAENLCAPASVGAVRDAERDLGFRLPAFYVRLLTEVGNGGFGPGYLIMGLPPDGYRDDDLPGSVVDIYNVSRRSRERKETQDEGWRIPEGLLHLCNWGCGTFSYVDCFDPDGRVITSEGLQDGMRYTETWPSLSGWLEQWARGADLGREMYETVGHPRRREPVYGQADAVPDPADEGAGGHLRGSQVAAKGDRAVFRATICGVFSVPGRGTYVEIEIVEGEVRAGDLVRLPVISGSPCVASVEAVEYVDRSSAEDSHVALHVPSVRMECLARTGEVTSAGDPE